MVNSQLHEGITDNLNSTITYGHISNTGWIPSVIRIIKSMVYIFKEENAIIFGKYKEDAFGLPVCWKKPQNLEKKDLENVDNHLENN